MKILTRYIWKSLAVTIALSMFLVFGLELIFSLVNELRYVGKGDYTVWHVIMFNLLSMPQNIYQMFPMAALVGTLLGLGGLAASSELVVIRAAGVSTKQIIDAVLKFALILSVLAWGLGEWVAPITDHWAQNQKAVALSGGQTLKTQHGVWLRDGKRFVNIQSVEVGGHLEGIVSYEFNDQQELIEASQAQYADYINELWVLYDVSVTTFKGTHIEQAKYDKLDWHSHIDPTILRIVGTKYLDELSLIGLWQTIDYRKKNDLDYRPYQLAFWQKVMQPFAIVMMMFLAVPFVFGPLRSSTKGFKLVVGILLGFSFYIFHKLFGPLTLVYQIHPIIGASLPTIIFFMGGCYALKHWKAS